MEMLRPATLLPWNSYIHEELLIFIFFSWQKQAKMYNGCLLLWIWSTNRFTRSQQNFQREVALICNKKHPANVQRISGQTVCSDEPQSRLGWKGTCGSLFSIKFSVLMWLYYFISVNLAHLIYGYSLINVTINITFVFNFRGLLPSLTPAATGVIL